MRQHRIWAPVSMVVVLASMTFFNVNAADYKPINLDPSYNHDRFSTVVTGPAGEQNHIRNFRAYMTVFDGADDDNGDGVEDRLAIPHYVAYEMRRYEGTLKKGPKRPSPWITDKKLWKLRLAPKDQTYAYSTAFRSNNPNWYVRGHLCMKQHAWRLGANADWNTHTMLNAVPQRQNFNAGIWLDLEDLTAEWADKYGAVWVVAGPIFEPEKLTPTDWLGEPKKGEVAAAIPDKLFKIVIRETEDPNRPEVLAFAYPQDVGKSNPYDHRPYLFSVDDIEKKTGLDFLTILPDEIEEDIEKVKAISLWPAE